MPKLTDIQSELLATAAARSDLAVLPPPAMLKAKGATLERTLNALRRRGLIAEATTDKRRKARAMAEAGDDGGRPVRLVITSKGLDAVGVQRGPTPDLNAVGESARQETGAVETRTGRPDGKMGMLLDTVARPGGASMEDLIVATGWLPHTTRAALTRLRQRGYDVQLGTVGERKAYRLSGTSLNQAVAAVERPA